MPSEHFQVVVIGGGSAGITAAIQAARAGASTLLVERTGMLGGTTTTAAVNFPGLFHAWGKQVIAGIGWDLVRKTVETAGETLPDFTNFRQRHNRLQVWVNRALYACLADEAVVESGARPLFHTMLAGLRHDGDRWRVTLCHKEGLAEYTADIIVDCTGDADAVFAAGYPCRQQPHKQPGTLVFHVSGYDFDSLDLDAIEADFAIALTDGRVKRPDIISGTAAGVLRGRGGNCMHIVDIDGATSAGRTHAELEGRRALLRLYRFFRSQPGLEHFRIDFVAPEVGIRETRTIEGLATVTVDDYITGQLWPDAVCYSYYPIDLHRIDGHGIDIRPLPEGSVPSIPLRAMIPAAQRHPAAPPLPPACSPPAAASAATSSPTPPSASKPPAWPPAKPPARSPP